MLCLLAVIATSNVAHRLVYVPPLIAPTSESTYKSICIVTTEPISAEEYEALRKGFADLMKRRPPERARMIIPEEWTLTRKSSPH